MVRIKRANVARRRRKKILQLAKGYKGSHSCLFRVANQKVLKAKRNSYQSRKLFKRIKRREWILTIGNHLNRYSFTYSRTLSLMKSSKIALNRRILTQLISNDPLMLDYIFI